ncbi:MAG: hypothetical protein ACE37D_15825 [Pseudomonadales bacterium]
MKETLKQQKHQEVFELIPWLVNDTLEGKERLRVLNHLNDCAVCQAERDRQQELAVLVLSDEDELEANYKPAFAKLMERIDSQATGEMLEPTQAEEVVAPPRNTGGKGKVTLAMAASVFVVVASIGLYQVSREPAETLTAPVLQAPETSLPGGESRRLAVTFDENIDSATLRAAFIDTGAYIVSGPDAEGRYVIEAVKSAGESQAEFVATVSQLDGVKHVALLD